MEWKGKESGTRLLKTDTFLQCLGCDVCKWLSVHQMKTYSKGGKEEEEQDVSCFSPGPWKAGGLGLGLRAGLGENVDKRVRP